MGKKTAIMWTLNSHFQYLKYCAERDDYKSHLWFNFTKVELFQTLKRWHEKVIEFREDAVEGESVMQTN